MKDDRKIVLAALKAAADKAPLPTEAIPPTPTIKPPIKNMTDCFLAAAKKNGATFTRISHRIQTPTAVAAHLREHGEKPELVLSSALFQLPWQEADIQIQMRPPLEDDSVGATEIAAAAADSGAMLLTGKNRYALSLSLLPPRHLAVLHACDIVPNLAALWKRIGDGMPQLCSLLCGPSRTADIEQTLTIGAHGPIAVHIILVEND